MGARKLRNDDSGKIPDRSAAKPDDLLVMATNNSSISSKRSVERLYYPNEPHFFRFFVKKFQRRAPLINRGYHLRLHVIDVTLRNFLRQPSPTSSSKTKVIVNLGCGSDVIPWQCWTRYPDDSRSCVQFVDVDFPDLIRNKRQIVLNTPELLANLSAVETRDTDPNVLLRSDRYTQIGVDLRNVSALENALSSIFNVRDCHFLFVAEVSITYMETSSADALIQWAASLGQGAEFCLLEQILPDGPDHPFATTMLKHFEKLSCPIKSVGKYSTIEQQCERFRDRGWSTIKAQSLWSAWSGDFFFTPNDRQQLDQIEPFDEHEEFALFASHYLLLHARNYGDNTTSMPPDLPNSRAPIKELDMTEAKLSANHGLRRFGAAMAVKDHFGKESIINCLGLGNNNRLSSYDVYTRGRPSRMNIKPCGGPTSRMCSTLTDLGHVVLLAGGRSSPSKPLSDCWIFRKDTKVWERTYDMPMPLYRHSACRLGNSSLVLFLGGKTGTSAISDLVMVYHPEDGWLICNVRGSIRPKVVFGATLICSSKQPGCQLAFTGLLMGGISEGVIDSQIQKWTLLFENNKEPTIIFDKADVGDDTVVLLSRFGAACVQLPDSCILLGGIGSSGYMSRKDEIIAVSTTGRVEATSRLLSPAEITRPLIIGSSVVLSDDQDLVIIGGAATCFSMGTFWTRGVYTVKLPGSRRDTSTSGGWEFSHTGEIVHMPPDSLHVAREGSHSAEIRPVRRVKLDSGHSFEKLLALDQPAILEGLDLGPCTTKWSLDYLTRQIGKDRKVVVHDSHSQSMDFNAKNFRYATVPFGEFAMQVKNGGKQYLRALSAEAPADRPANLDQDFPLLAPDFVLPDKLRFCIENIHSSVLRISGPVRMWLHYDVQANVYCQISGSKRMLLYPPSDINHLSFAPGASSSSIDVFDSINSPALANTHPQEAELLPGDVLFLPPLWLHTSAPTSDTSIAVNVFFRSLEAGQYAAGRDVYGNRDLAAYDKGRQDIARIVNSFGKVSTNCKQFYLLRLADELAANAGKQRD